MRILCQNSKSQTNNVSHFGDSFPIVSVTKRQVNIHSSAAVSCAYLPENPPLLFGGCLGMVLPPDSTPRAGLLGVFIRGTCYEHRHYA